MATSLAPPDPDQAAVPPTSALIFPSQVAHASLSSVRSALRAADQSPAKRLRSIAADAAFVTEVATALGLPIIANERCGSWYVDPELKAGSAYFKSTDGHNGQWAFSLRRLNLAVLKIANRSQGCIIVDSTRRGKSMPDALSKTVPIWCAVMNRMLFPPVTQEHALRTPSEVVSASEHAQIASRLDGFYRQVQELDLDIDHLRSLIDRPLRPCWITRDSKVSARLCDTDRCIPIVLCTTSLNVRGSEARATSYVQGAGDDAESWAESLNPRLFWENKELLLSATEESISPLIASLVKGTALLDQRKPSPVLISPTTTLFIGLLDSISTHAMLTDTHVITCCENPPDLIKQPLSTYNLTLSSGKPGSRALRTTLGTLFSYLSSLKSLSISQRILVACPTGRDFSVGVALAILCLCFDDSGQWTGVSTPDQKNTDKVLIRKRLAWIVGAVSGANPSRATLVAVNSFLMARENGR